MTATIRYPAALTLASLLAATAAAATPETVLWSARVENASGPVDGTVSLTLGLFAAATGGTALHEESVPSAVVVDGELVHELGAAADNPLDDAVLDHPALFLQVTMNGETLAPRLPIRSVPYALRAEQCSSLEGLSADDVATDADVVAALAAHRPAFSSLTGLPAGLADGELTPASGAGLFTSGNTIGIAGGGVIAGMIANGAVTQAKLGVDVVTSAAIAAGAVASSEIADGSISSADIQDGAITGNDIGSLAVRDTHVNGVRIYAKHEYCADRGTLVTSASCSTVICAGSPQILYYECDGQCASTRPEGCSNEYLGKLAH